MKRTLVLSIFSAALLASCTLAGRASDAPSTSSAPPTAAPTQGQQGTAATATRVVGTVQAASSPTGTVGATASPTSTIRATSSPTGTVGATASPAGTPGAPASPTSASGAATTQGTPGSTAVARTEATAAPTVSSLATQAPTVSGDLDRGARTAGTATTSSFVQLQDVLLGATDTVFVLHNTGSTDVDLSGWAIQVGQARVELPDGAQLPAHGTLRVHTANGPSTRSDVYLGDESTALIRGMAPGAQVVVLNGRNDQIAEFQLPG